MLYNDYEIMTVDEVCDYLNIRYSMLCNLLNSGNVSAFLIVNRWKIPGKCIDKYINGIVLNK